MIRIVLLYLVFVAIGTAESLPASIIHPEADGSDFENTLTDMKCIDFSTSLIESEIYRSFVKNHKTRAHIYRKTSQQIGDTLSFSVRNFYDQTKWNNINSVLVFDTTGLSIWVESESINNLLTTLELALIIEKFTSYLFDKSGPYSVDTSEGILNIMGEYFGSPPDIDGDGKLDILLLDIDDNFASSGSYIAGFFDPNDLTNSPTSNRRDIIYIDLYPSIVFEGELSVERSIPTLAHEYQHLIHINYEGPEREYIFINEGLSELAEIVCGFTPRSESKFLEDPFQPLFEWNQTDPLSDYSRASLWTHYLFEQIGYDYISKLVQSSLTGPADLSQLCHRYSERTFPELFVDWSVTNLVNNGNIDSRYGYNHPMRKDFKVSCELIEPKLPVVNELRIGNFCGIPVNIPHVNEFSFASSSSHLFTTVIAEYPNGLIEILPQPSTSFYVSLDDFQNGSAILLACNLSPPNSEGNLEHIVTQYVLSGKKTGINQ